MIYDAIFPVAVDLRREMVSIQMTPPFDSGGLRATSVIALKSAAGVAFSVRSFVSERSGYLSAISIDWSGEFVSQRTGSAPDEWTSAIRDGDETRVGSAIDLRIAPLASRGVEVSWGRRELSENDGAPILVEELFGALVCSRYIRFASGSGALPDIAVDLAEQRRGGDQPVRAAHRQEARHLLQVRRLWPAVPVPVGEGVARQAGRAAHRMGAQ